MPYIEVCGGIASGKTTIARLFKQVNIEVILEDFQSNPFWNAFYLDPVSHAFETEVTFLLQHYHQIKINQKKNKAFICDFSLLLDIAYSDVTLLGSKKKVFLSVHNEIAKNLSPPDLIIHLHCSPNTELKRIKKRGRAIESKITLEYLNALNEAIDYRMSTISNKINILSINSESNDFISDKQAQTTIISLVNNAISKHK